eukprot:6175629-Pleurochrysis_carterae.AAC.3
MRGCLRRNRCKPEEALTVVEGEPQSNATPASAMEQTLRACERRVQRHRQTQFHLKPLRLCFTLHLENVLRSDPAKSFPRFEAQGAERGFETRVTRSYAGFTNGKAALYVRVPPRAYRYDRYASLSSISSSP